MRSPPPGARTIDDARVRELVTRFATALERGDADDQDDRNGDKSHEIGHGRGPPRDPEIPLLWRGSDREEDGIDRGGRGPVGPVLQECSSGAIKGLIVVHASRPSRRLSRARDASKAARSARVA